MKTMVKLILAVTTGLILTSPQGLNAQQPVGPQFTYQGQLNDAGSPATGAYDLRFTLFQDDSGIVQVGPVEEFLNFPIVDGQFSVELNFGFDAFEGDARWLQIEVDGVALTPLQEITSTPYATFSINTRGLSVNNNRVGIGTDSPERVLHTAGDAILVERDTSDSGMLMRHTGNGQIQGMVGIRSTGTDAGFVFLTDENSGVQIANRDGRTGIGTQTPERVLHTVGDAILVERSANDAAVVMRNTSNGQIDGQIGVRSTGANDGYLFVTDERLQRLIYLNDGYVGVGRDEPVVSDPTGQTWFDVEIPPTGDSVGGMYLNNENAGARSLYGYAVNGTSKAVMSFDDNFNTWALDIGSNFFDELVVKGDTGRVGIGVFNPTATLHVNGSALIAGGFEVSDQTPTKPNGGPWSAASDRRLKKNIQYLNGTLEKLLKLRGVTFEFKDPKAIGELEGEHVGMIAQEVEKIFPEWIGTRPDGYKEIAPYGFEALTVEALRELRSEKDRQLNRLTEEKDAQISALQDENQELRDRLEALEAAVANLNSK